MTAKLKQMLGREFVGKILEGERDFSGVNLETGFNLSGYEGFGEMQDYLKKANLGNNPIILDNSSFEGIKAQGLYLPCTQGMSVNFEGASLKWVYFWNGKFKNGKFKNGDFEYGNFDEAYLEYAKFRGANFTSVKHRSAKFRGADFNETYLGDVDFEDADLRGVKNLEKSLNLKYAKFHKTKVTSKEKAIIYAALKIEELLVIKD